MNYIIGAGAILEAGESGTITPATLHAEVDGPLAEQVRVAAVDFEATSANAMQRLLVVAQGWNAAQFRGTVTERLRRRRDCTLADVLGDLAEAAEVKEVHVFAHWLPDEETCAALACRGVRLLSHPLESIQAASVIAGQRHRRYAA